MPNDEDKSTMAERLTGRHDPKDPDGLLTVEQAENPPDPTEYGAAEEAGAARHDDEGRAPGESRSGR